MGSFITGIELEVIRDENWEAFESVTIREYSQGQKDAMDAETIEMAGQVGEVPRVVMQSAIVPILVAGIHSWTFRNLSEGEMLRLYESHAKRLDKDIDALSMEDKCEAVKDVPITSVAREWMSRLRPGYAGFIVKEIRRLNQGRTTAEERDFLRQIGLGDTEQEEAAAGDNFH